MQILIPWLVFGVFLLVAFFTRELYMVMATLVRFPRGLSARDTSRMASDVPLIRAWCVVGAVGSGVMAIGITIQEVLGKS